MPLCWLYIGGKSMKKLFLPSIVSFVASFNTKPMNIEKVFTQKEYELMMKADAYYFYALETEISKGHEGQRVVIQNCRVIGYFDSTMEAVGFMADNGQDIGAFSVHDCGKCKNEAVIHTGDEVCFVEPVYL
jgi:hypothetical protein